jgi:hypothetical protein
MQKSYNSIKLIVSAFLITVICSSCATVFGGRVSDCQKTKPLPGEKSRQLRPIPFVWQLVTGNIVGLAIDFTTGAIYKPCTKKS